MFGISLAPWALLAGAIAVAGIGGYVFTAKLDARAAELETAQAARVALEKSVAALNAERDAAEESLAIEASAAQLAAAQARTLRSRLRAALAAGDDACVTSRAPERVLRVLRQPAAGPDAADPGTATGEPAPG